MLMENQHPLCMKLHELRNENHDRIFELTQELYPDKCVTHDQWLTVVNEIMDRVNWHVHLSVMADRSYDSHNFDPEEARLTLHDYVYNVKPSF